MFTAPQKKTPWLVAGKSETGIARHTNEDAFFCGFPSGGSGFAVIADGVGGLEFGERASSTAVEGVRRHVEKTEFPVPARPDFAALFRALDAEIEALGEKYEGKVNVCKVDVDAEPQLAARFGVMSIPTVIAFENGKEIGKLVGLRPAADLEALIK